MRIEDFIYVANNDNVQQAVDSTLENVAKDAAGQSDSTFDIGAFLNNLLNKDGLNPVFTSKSPPLKCFCNTLIASSKVGS